MQKTGFKLTLRKNDQVQVIAGREKGKTGKIVDLDRDTGAVTIEKVNLVKRHVKASQKNPQGGILEKELPVNYSNVLLMCTKCNRGVRHGVKLVKQAGKKKGSEATEVKVRFCKKCGESLDA
ncbi:MAG: 50S ribosomal protein L24 [Bdellovibrionales bacterium GWB1_55_8]|nr:MAG: 50S ribosomal protein L24 [Bdellovibrionales bacterium GWB1_55_8]